MYFKKSLISILLILSALSSAQIITVPSFRGARNAAMGEALISESSDVSSTYLNPASLAFIKQSAIFFNHGQLDHNLGMTENFAVPVLRILPVTLLIGLDSYHLGYIGKMPAFADQKIFEYGYNLTAATNIIEPTFSIGATFGFRRSQTDHSRTWADYYSIGVNYSPSADINYGLVLSGLGSDISYVQEDSLLLAKRINAGKRLVVGASMKYPSASSLRRTIVVLALANEKIFDQDGLLYKAGIEFNPVEVLSLRFGYVYGPDISEPRFGAGLNFNILSLQYVYYAGREPAMLQQISLSIKI